MVQLIEKKGDLKESKVDECYPCPVCHRPMIKPVRGAMLTCQNGCDRLTARAPDHNTARSMSYESMGDGCYVKSPARIE